MKQVLILTSLVLGFGSEVLQELDNTESGSEILDSISLQLSVDTPIQEITQPLNSFISVLEAQEPSHDCEVSLTLFSNLISQAKGQVSYAQKQLDKYLPIIERVNSQVQKLQKGIFQAEQELKDLKEFHEAEVQEHQLQEERVQKEISMCDSIVKGVALGSFKPQTPITSALLQVAQNSNQKDKAVSAASSLKQNLQSSLEVLKSNYQKTQDLFNKLTFQIESRKRTCEAELEYLQPMLEEDQARVSDSKASLTQSQNALERNQQLYEQKVQMCEEEKQQTTAQDLQNQVQLIKQVIDMLENNEPQINQYLKLRNLKDRAGKGMIKVT